MPELLLVVGLVLTGAYGYAVHGDLAERRRHAVAAATARLPTRVDEDGYLSAARDHYRRLARWARLLEDLRGAGCDRGCPPQLPTER